MKIYKNLRISPYIVILTLLCTSFDLVAEERADVLYTNEATNLYSTSVTLNGSASLTSPGLFSDVEFIYKKTGSATTTIVQAATFVFNGQSFSADISGLDPGSDYQFLSRGILVTGGDTATKYGEWKSFKTYDQWTGTTNKYWNIGSNWSSGNVPTSSVNLVIPSVANLPEIYFANGSCRDIVIEPGASLFINGKSLTASTGDVTLKSSASGTSTGEIAVSSSGSLNISGGSAVFNQYIPGNRWVFVSVPMSGVTADDFYLNLSPEVYLSYFIENGGHPGENEYCEDCWGYIEDETTSVNLMQGYKMWIAGSSHVYEFSSSNFVSGSKSFTMSLSGAIGSGYGWNLIGNPYPSHVDWDAVSKSNLQNNGYYTWNGSAFIAYNNGLSTPKPSLGVASRYIPPFQGFFVRTSSDNSSITFDNSMRKTSSSTLYKEDSISAQDYVRLSIIEKSTPEYRDETIVRFLSGAAAQYDKIGDAYKMYGNYEIPQIFTYIEDGTELAINALPQDLKNNAIVPLAVFIAMDGEFQFTATEMESFTSSVGIRVRDKVSGEVYNLNQNATFEIELDSGYYLNRFEMIFEDNTGIPDQISLNNNKIQINSDNQCINITVLGDNSISAGTLQASVYDMTGRQILSQEVNKKGLTRIYMQQSSGWYVVRVIGSNINKVKKVFFKKN